MSTCRGLALVLFGAALSLPISCSSQKEQGPSPAQADALTSALAKTALLDMIHSKPAKDLGWFEEDAADRMAKMMIEKDEDGWYTWTGAFRLNPSKAIYTFEVRPQPGLRACVFLYNGSFVKRDGRWSATVPRLISTALQNGK
jgi:hypothetical protein